MSQQQASVGLSGPHYVLKPIYNRAWPRELGCVDGSKAVYWADPSTIMYQSETMIAPGRGAKPCHKTMRLLMLVDTNMCGGTEKVY